MLTERLINYLIEQGKGAPVPAWLETPLGEQCLGIAGGWEPLTALCRAIVKQQRTTMAEAAWLSKREGSWLMGVRHQAGLGRDAVGKTELVVGEETFERYFVSGSQLRLWLRLEEIWAEQGIRSVEPGSRPVRNTRKRGMSSLHSLLPSGF